VDLELVFLTEDEFEDLRGMSFGTFGKNTVNVQTKLPTWSKKGQEFYSYAEFEIYEDYLKHNNLK
jgi:hypothetical protein